MVFQQALSQRAGAACRDWRNGSNCDRNKSCTVLVGGSVAGDSVAVCAEHSTASVIIDPARRLRGLVSRLRACGLVSPLYGPTEGVGSRRWQRPRCRFVPGDGPESK
jgi:hypothetical protein